MAKGNEFRDAAEAAVPTAQQARRRPYVAPVLEDLGDLRDVTLGGSARRRGVRWQENKDRSWDLTCSPCRSGFSPTQWRRVRREPALQGFVGLVFTGNHPGCSISPPAPRWTTTARCWRTPHARGRSRAPSRRGSSRATRVVDLGCGSGILAFFACRAGARRVYALEDGATHRIGQGPVPGQRVCRSGRLHQRAVHARRHPRTG